ncbi:MAG: SRPBCC family protein [Actinomycetota bacterium]|nr:SRPBCC family protein [Actinomycetota bacterium]
MAAGDLLKRGWPISVEVSETLPGPPEVVWELITDWENQGDWMLEARDFVVTSAEREGLGVEAEATITIGGIRTRDRVRVIGWEPHRRLAIEHRGWVSGIGEMFLTPLGADRAHLFWREELQPPLGLLGAIGLTTFRPLMGRLFRRDVRVLAGLVRARAAAVKAPKKKGPARSSGAFS